MTSTHDAGVITIDFEANMKSAMASLAALQKNSGKSGALAAANYAQNFSMIGAKIEIDLSKFKAKETKKAKEAGSLVGGKLAESINKTIAEIGIRSSVEKIFKQAEIWESAGRKLRATAEGIGNAQIPLSQIADIASQAGTELSATVDLFNAMSVAGAQLGLSTADVVTATDLLTQSFATAGLSASEQKTAMDNFGETFKNGSFSKEKLMELSQTAPLAFEAIAQSIGTTNAELLNLDQTQSAVTVFNAILGHGVAIEAQFQKTAPTVAQSMETLRTESARVAGEMQGVEIASDVMAKLILVVANNFEHLSRAAIVAGSAIAGPLAAVAMQNLYTSLRAGSQSAIAIVRDLGRFRAGTLTSANAATALGRAITLMGGPITIVISLLAAAVAYFVLTADAAKDAEETIAEANGLMNDYKSTQKQLADDTKLLKEKTDALNESIKASGETAQDAAKAEIDAIRLRIAKNRELQKIYENDLRLKVSTAEKETRKADAQQLAELTHWSSSRVATRNKALKDEDYRLALEDTIRDEQVELSALLEEQGALSNKDSKRLEKLNAYFIDKAARKDELDALRTNFDQLKNSSANLDKEGPAETSISETNTDSSSSTHSEGPGEKNDRVADEKAVNNVLSNRSNIMSSIVSQQNEVNNLVQKSAEISLTFPDNSNHLNQLDIECESRAKINEETDKGIQLELNRIQVSNSNSSVEQLETEVDLLKEKNAVIAEGKDEKANPQDIGKVKDLFKGGIKAAIDGDFEDYLAGKLESAADSMFDNALDTLLDGLLGAGGPLEGIIGSLFGGGEGSGDLLGNLFGNLFGGGKASATGEATNALDGFTSELTAAQGGLGSFGGALGGLGALFGAGAGITELLGGNGKIGGLLGILPGLFAGFFADGGVVPRGKFAIVGEQGPEVISSGAAPLRVTPLNDNYAATATAGMIPDGGGMRQMSYAPINNFYGHTQDDLRRSLDERDRSLKAEMPGLMDRHSFNRNRGMA